MTTLDTEIEEEKFKGWIKIPDYIYYTGKVTLRYQNPDGEWMESTFYPNDCKTIKALIEREVEKEKHNLIVEVFTKKARGK